MQRKIVQLLFLLLFWPGFALSQVGVEEKLPEGGTIMISREYARGPYFIYNCDDRHFACVDDVSIENCQLDRTVALRDRKYHLPCAPLRKFLTQKECISEHYKLVHNLSLKYFCLNQKNILILDDAGETKAKEEAESANDGLIR